MMVGPALALSGFVGLFLLGVHGGLQASKQVRAGRGFMAWILVVLSGILLIVSATVLVIAASWLL